MTNTQTSGENTREERPRPALSPVNNRSRITNGKQLWGGVDGRSREARRWRDIYADYMARTDGQHEQLCRALASMVVRREALDAAIARGEHVDPLDLVRIVGAINRTMEKCGLVAETAAKDAPVDMTDRALEIMREAWS